MGTLAAVHEEVDGSMQYSAKGKRCRACRRLLPLLLLTASAATAACGRDHAAPTARASGLEFAPAILRQYGCGACHAIAGVPGADGRVGPPLTGIGERVYIAGTLPNTEENLVRWIMDPQAMRPGTAMPDVGVNEVHARIMAAYLYSLR